MPHFAIHETLAHCRQHQACAPPERRAAVREHHVSVPVIHALRHTACGPRPVDDQQGLRGDLMDDCCVVVKGSDGAAVSIHL